MTPEYVRVYERFRSVVRAMECRGLWTAGEEAKLAPLLAEAGDNPLVIDFLEMFTAIFENVLRRAPPEDRECLDELMTAVGPRLQEHHDFVLRHLMGRRDRWS